MKNKILGFESPLSALENTSTFKAIRAIENLPAMKAARAIEKLTPMKNYGLNHLYSDNLGDSLSPLKSTGIASLLGTTITGTSLLVGTKLSEISSLAGTKALGTHLDGFQASGISFLSDKLVPLKEHSIMSVAKGLEGLTHLNSSLASIKTFSKFGFSDIGTANYHSISLAVSKLYGSNLSSTISLGEAYRDLYEHFSLDTNIPEEDRFEKLGENIEKRIEKAPKGSLSSEFYINLLIALIMFWVANMQSEESEKRLHTRMEKLETTVIQQILELKKDKEIESFYVVKRGVNLRVRPTTKSEVISTLHRNVKVKLIARKSKWIRIEYFDYIDEVYISGWVYKKYLKRINNM